MRIEESLKSADLRIENVEFGSCAILDEDACIVVNDHAAPKETVRCVRLCDGRSLTVAWGTMVTPVRAKVVIE